jgi:hypothetical protein
MTPIETTNSGPGGPNTPEGKAISSRNALKTGLFATRDFIREEENEEYTEVLADLFRQLTPEGHLENSLVDEIMSATWRLRRCRSAEANGDVDDDTVARARSHAHNMLRRSLAELRKLQTERTIRLELEHVGFPGIADSRQILNAIRAQHVIIANAPGQLPPPEGDDLSALDAFLAQATRNMPPSSSFCKIPESAPGHAAQAASGPSQPDPEPATTPAPTSSFCKSTPRNSPCPCGSGLKHKRCCGTNAPPVLSCAA